MNIKDATKLLGRLVASNREFGNALSVFSHADHRIGTGEWPLLNSVKGMTRTEIVDARKRKAEKVAAEKLEIVEEIIADTEWSNGNRDAMKACLDAGIKVTNDLHQPGHMLKTIRELQGLRAYYSDTRMANREQTIGQRCDALAAQLEKWGIDTTGYLPVKAVS